MSERRARYVGHPDGVDLTIPFKDGDTVHLHVAHGDELPSEVEGRKVPAEFCDSLLEQADNWTTGKTTKKGDD